MWRYFAHSKDSEETPRDDAEPSTMWKAVLLVTLKPDPGSRCGGWEERNQPWLGRPYPPRARGQRFRHWVKPLEDESLLEFVRGSGFVTPLDVAWPGSRSGTGGRTETLEGRGVKVPGADSCGHIAVRPLRHNQRGPSRGRFQSLGEREGRRPAAGIFSGKVFHA